jgi:hypothetical protein
MHYISYNFEVKDLYGSHQVSLHIYFNKDMVFYEILSSWHVYHSWITPPVPSLYLLEKIQELHYEWTCQPPNLHTPLFTSKLFKFYHLWGQQKTMKMIHLNTSKLFQKNILFKDTGCSSQITSCLNVNSHFENTYNITLCYPTDGLISCTYLLGLIQLLKWTCRTGNLLLVCH